MRLEWFQVQGYKNLRAPVRLGDLGRVNVLHGDNNVGKSNLLESVGLLFVAIQAVREEARGPSIAERHARVAAAPEAAPEERTPREAVRSFEYFAARGYPPADIFDLKGAGAMELEAELTLDRGAGDPEWLGEPIRVGVHLELDEEDEVVSIRITRLERSDRVDLATGGGDQHAADTDLALALERLGPRVHGKESLPRFALVRADRTLLGEAADHVSPLAPRELLPVDLALALLDAENDKGARRERFKRFTAALGHFRDLVGPGRWRMRYDMDADRAELCLDDGDDLLPLRLMGSGIQQVVVLCARLIMTGADILAIEEPELNLRWTVQRALLAALDEIAAHEESPSQLILTSHSGQFERPPFYLLSRSEAGPRVHKTSNPQKARELTQPAMPAPPEGSSAPRGYLTTEGLVQVAPEVQEHLGLAHGGGVVFVREKGGHYRMLTDDQFLDLFEDRGTEP